MDSLDLARYIVDVIADQKGENIVLLDIQDVSILADYFVLASTSSERQAKAILEDIKTKAKHEHGIKPLHIEGDATNGWVLLDYTDVVVHLFSHKMRDYYDLEGLWKEARVIVRML
jgi:ribosome-associated protein